MPHDRSVVLECEEIVGGENTAQTTAFIHKLCTLVNFDANQLIACSPISKRALFVECRSFKARNDFMAMVERYGCGYSSRLSTANDWRNCRDVKVNFVPKFMGLLRNLMYFYALFQIVVLILNLVPFMDLFETWFEPQFKRIQTLSEDCPDDEEDRRLNASIDDHIVGAPVGGKQKPETKTSSDNVGFFLNKNFSHNLKW